MRHYATKQIKNRAERLQLRKGVIMYYLVRTYKKHKRAKRHIVLKGSLEYVERFVKSINYISNDRYKVEIYNGKWELIKIL